MSTDQEKVEKVLGEPFAMDFSDNVRKIRNNLIITSIIAIALLLGGISDLLPYFSANLNLVKSVFEKENGLEEAIYGRADHRISETG
jgi:high-affinity nickel permease